MGIALIPVAPRAAWPLLPAGVGAVYMLERRRAARSTVLAEEQSGAVFRMLVASMREGTSSLHEAAPEPGVTLEQEGDFWRIGYEGTNVLIRHSRGLALLAHLIRNPGQEIHVSALDAITPSGGSAVARRAPAPDGGVPPARGDEGEVLDAQARTEYRRRITEIRAELEEADASRDLGRAETLRAELQLLEDELRGASRRGRRAPRDIERLRVAITHRIRDAVAQIAKHHPTLGAHLSASVSTGYRCVYRPGGRVNRE
jgi:hypothetical protein